MLHLQTPLFKFVSFPAVVGSLSFVGTAIVALTVLGIFANIDQTHQHKEDFLGYRGSWQPSCKDSSLTIRVASQHLLLSDSLWHLVRL